MFMVINRLKPNRTLTKLLFGTNKATALQRAAYMGHVAVVEVLIASGASLDLKDSDGCTALHKASAQVRF